MQSARNVVLALVLCGCLGCAGTRAPSPREPSAGPTTALDVLHLRQPATKWDSKSLLQADLDQDGTADFAVLGRGEDHFVVGIVHGPVNAGKDGVWTLDFPWDGGEDALCAKHAKIALESLEENEGPEEDQPHTGQGLNLSDDRCDAFHIYWNPRKKQFDWWRL
jgi:hypothetical protein